MDAKERARRLVAYADGPLEDLFQKTPTLWNDLPFNSTDEMYNNGSLYVGQAGDWLAEANSTLSIMSPADPDPIIDELSARITRIVPRRTLLHTRGFGKAWVPGTFRDEVYKQVSERFKFGVNLTGAILVIAVMLYLTRGR